MEQYQVQIKCEEDVDNPQFFEISFKCEDQNEAADDYPLVKYEESTKGHGNHPQVTQIKIEYEDDEGRTEDGVNDSQLPLTRTFLYPEYEVNKCEITIEDTKLIYPVTPTQSSPIQRTYECYSCKYFTGTLADLRKHLLKHSARRSNQFSDGSTKFECNKCAKNFRLENLLRTHTLRVHSELRPFECEVCSKKFAIGSDLKKHKKTHNDKSIGCAQCPQKFNSQWSLTHHMRIHSGVKPFQCVEYLKKFLSKCELKSHMSVHNEDRPLGCNICQKQFKTKDSITQHMRHHSSRKPFVCSECSKSFKTRNGFKLHRLNHTKEEREKPFQCNMCPYKTATKSHLLLHTRVHTGEKPYTCKFCQKKFGTSSYLKTHSYIHTGEKPFACYECPMKFRARSSLRRHNFIHTREKKFETQ